jgi:hypothetical protein
VCFPCLKTPLSSQRFFRHTDPDFEESLYISKRPYCSFLHRYLLLHRSCLIIVDFAMAASKNGVCITQQILYVIIMILFHDSFMIKDESNFFKSKFFVIF